VPQNGTFWSLQFTNFPPYPFLPISGVAVYSTTNKAGNTVFLFDDREVDYLALQELSMLSGPPLPTGGGDDGGGTNEWGSSSFAPLVFGTNDLWLEIRTNSPMARFIIHTPNTNAIYDLFGTTNLVSTVPGLNATNWAWLYRTRTNQLDFVYTDLWPNMAFFRLGKMTDNTGNGFTDAYDDSVHDSDTDDDGVPNWEDIAPNNPAVGRLKITINNPANRAVIGN